MCCVCIAISEDADADSAFRSAERYQCMATPDSREAMTTPAHAPFPRLFILSGTGSSSPVSDNTPTGSISPMIA
jgi:hypothetical protein